MFHSSVYLVNRTVMNEKTMNAGVVRVYLSLRVDISQTCLLKRGSDEIFTVQYEMKLLM